VSKVQKHLALKIFDFRIDLWRWARGRSESGKKDCGTAASWRPHRVTLSTERLNEVLDNAGFDTFCETNCASFYHDKPGRLSLAPGLYFRIMMIGFFEGLDGERGIAWRLADSLTLRQFLSIGQDEKTADHVTISRTRRLIDALDGAGSQHSDEIDCPARHGRGPRSYWR
jgi:hypothetical protein